MRKLKILTFNHHEAYLALFKNVPHEFDVVIKYKDLSLNWSKSSHELPKNMNLIAFDENTVSRLKNAYYDVVICHTIKNLLWLFPFYKQKFVFIAHIPIFNYSFPLKIKSWFKRNIFKIFKLTHDVKFVSITEFKDKTWNIKGSEVILNAPSRFEELPENHSFNKVISVGNHIAERGVELGYSTLKQLLQENIPITIVGNNPSIPQSIHPKSFKSFLETFRSCGIYLYVISHPYGDGFNLSMLEAMGMGMPVITIFNPTSPIIHKKNGLVCNNIDEIKDSINYLLTHPDEAKRMGREAKKTIDEIFSIERFTSQWNHLLSEL